MLSRGSEKVLAASPAAAAAIWRWGAAPGSQGQRPLAERGKVLRGLTGWQARGRRAVAWGGIVWEMAGRHGARACRWVWLRKAVCG